MPAYDRSQLRSLKTGYFYRYFPHLLRQLDFTTFLLGCLSSELFSLLPIEITSDKGTESLVPSFDKISNYLEEKINFFSQGMF